MDVKYDVTFTFDVCTPTGAVQAVPGRFLSTVVRRTILNLVSYFADNASGPCCVIERFLPGRAGSPLVA